MKQIVIIVENKVGVIADISRLLSEHNINIERIDAVGEEEAGTIVLSTDNYDAALRALKAASYQAISEEACVIRLPDKPGALARVASRFQEAQLNIRSMHIVQRQKGHAIVALVASEPEKGRHLLKDVLVA